MLKRDAVLRRAQLDLAQCKLVLTPLTSARGLKTAVNTSGEAEGGPANSFCFGVHKISRSSNKIIKS